MIRWTICSLFLAAVTIGCTRAPAGKTPSAKKSDAPLVASAEGKKYLLEAEPAGAKGVVEIRKDSRDGDNVVLVGRIAGSRKPFVEGRASFSVVDLNLKLDVEEGCTTPWACCCVATDDLMPALAQVKIAGPDGKTLGVGARELFGVKEMTVVVVTGKANRDDKGNLTVVASGLHVRDK